MRRGRLACVVLLALAAPAFAQSTEDQDALREAFEAPPAPEPMQVTLPGRTAESAVGQVGERQTRQATAGIKPTARINSRINNRVQSRIRNRIDRYYDPRANATSPFEVAEEEARQAGR